MLRKLGFTIAVCTVLPGCMTTPEPHEPGGPFYFERFIHRFPSFYPTLASREIPRSRASSRAFFIVAWFNDRGQIERMLKCLDNQPSFDLRYRYGPDGAYEGEDYAPLPSAESPEDRRLTRACS